VAKQSSLAQHELLITWPLVTEPHFSAPLDFFFEQLSLILLCRFSFSAFSCSCQGFIELLIRGNTSLPVKQCNALARKTCTTMNASGHTRYRQAET